MMIWNCSKEEAYQTSNNDQRQMQVVHVSVLWKYTYSCRWLCSV